MIKEHPSYIYAEAIVKNKIQVPQAYIDLNPGKKFISPKYVKKQCKDFLNIANGKDKKYIINEKLVAKIDKICKIFKMAKGLKTGKPIYDSLAGYQWLLIVASLCTVHRDDITKRRYESIILEIARKNGKTFIVAFLVLLLFYLEPKFSRFFSVAPDGSLAKEIKNALDTLIKANIDVFEQDEFNSLILKNDFVMITKQTIDGTNFVDIEKVESDLNE